MSSKVDEFLFDVASSPVAFRDAVIIRTDKGQAIASSCLDDWQLEAFQATDPAWMVVAGLSSDPAKMCAYFCRPRAHSKSSDTALNVVWALFAAPHAITILGAAADKDQAQILRKAVKQILDLNAWLAAFFDVQKDRVVNKSTGSELLVISSDAMSSFGHLCDAIVCDEFTHWGANEEFWCSLVSTAAKRSTCMLTVLTNAGVAGSWQEGVVKSIEHDPSWHFSHLDGPQASWVTAETLANQKRILRTMPLFYQRMWLNQWVAGSGDALDPADVAFANKMRERLWGPEPGWTYAIGCDIGIYKDATAVVVVGRHDGYTEMVEQEPDPAAIPTPLAIMRRQGLLIDEPGDPVFLPHLPRSSETTYHRHDGTGKLKVAAIYYQKAPAGGHVDLAKVEANILEEYRRFGVAVVAFDYSQSEDMRQRLARRSIPTETIHPSSVNLKIMASAMLEAFIDRKIEFFDDERLTNDLHNLRVEEKSYGIRLASPRDRFGHGDVASALSVALCCLRSLSPPAKTTIDGPLLCWP